MTGAILSVPSRRQPGGDRDREAPEEAGARARSTPLERIEMLCDPASVRVMRSGIQPLRARRSEAGDGVIGATGRIEGRPVAVYAQDASFLGGSLGAAHAETIVKVQGLARRSGIPAIGLVESAGARMDEGTDALAGYGRIFSEHVAATSWIPQVSVICGVSAGGGCYSPALTDLVVMCEGATMFLTGPQVVEEVIGERVGNEDLGGPAVHRATGVSQMIARDPGDAARLVRNFLSYLPSNSDESPPRAAPREPGASDPGAAVPDEPRKVYDVAGVAAAIADQRSLLELAPGWAPNLFTAFARLGGGPAGIIANQPRHLAGVLDAAAAEKGAWFVELCDAFGLPLVVLVDTPGFMPGVREERRGVIRLGARLVRAFAAARVPKVTVVLRKAFGGAYITMNSLALGADLAFAWSGAEIGVMAPTQAVAIVNRRALAELPPERFDAERERLASIYAAEHTGVGRAAAAGHVDEVIEPGETRARVLEAISARAGDRGRTR